MEPKRESLKERKVPSSKVNNKSKQNSKSSDKKTSKESVIDSYVSNRTIPRMLEKYQKDVVPMMRENFSYRNIMEVPKVEKIFCAPGNAGTSEFADNIPIAADDIEGLLQFAMKKEIGLTVVGPEQPLVMGIVDRFEIKGLRIFGPSASAAELEGSKSFSKDIMQIQEEEILTAEVVMTVVNGKIVYERK